MKSKIKPAVPYAYAVLGEGVGIFINLLLFVLVQQKYGVAQLAIYMLIRRTISMILPAVMFGTPLSLIRYLSIQENPIEKRKLVTLGILVPSLAASLLMLLAVAIPNKVSVLLLGGKEYSEYVLPMFTFVLFLALSLVIISVFKGLHKLNEATSTSIYFVSVLPLLSIFISDSLTNFFYAFSLLSLFSVAILLLYYRINIFRKPDLFYSHDFVFFGAKGAACEFVFMFMLWLPPFIIASSDEIEKSGYFSLMISLVLVASSPIPPVASVLMPAFSKYYDNNDKKMYGLLIKKIYFLAAISIPLYLLSVFVYPYIANYLMPGSSPLGPRATNVLLTAILPVSTYYTFRNMIDVIFTPKRNLYNLTISSMVFLLIYAGIMIYSPIYTRIAVVVGFVVGLWVLGTLTVIYIYRSIGSTALKQMGDNAG